MATFISSIYTIPGLYQVERDLAAMLVQTLETSCLLQQRYNHLMFVEPYLRSMYYSHPAMLLQPFLQVKVFGPTAMYVLPSWSICCNTSHFVNTYAMVDGKRPRRVSVDINNNNAAVSSSIMNQPRTVYEELSVQTKEFDFAVESAFNHFLSAKETSNMMKYFDM